jgi:NADH-quinone oxidoreductase subunit L
MAAVLIVLAVGSVVTGYVGLSEAFFGSNRIEAWLEPSFMVSHPAEVHAGEAARGSYFEERALAGVSALVAVAGIAIAGFFFLRNRRAADRLADRFLGLYRTLVNKYYVDEVYQSVVVRPLLMVSAAGLWKRLDVRVLDGAVNGVGGLVLGAGLGLRRVQTGSVRAYAASVLVGVVVVLGYYLWR